MMLLSFCHFVIFQLYTSEKNCPQFLAMTITRLKSYQLSVIKNLESLALGIVQIFAQIGGDFLYPNYKILGGKEKDLT